MRIWAGTSGYSYKEWKGAFYPEDLPAAGMLGHYAQRLGAVEINNTFYRMPKRAVVEKWAEQVPADFSFSLKASQRITHKKRLKEAEEETSYLLSQLEALGPHLGVVLFQLPPNLKADLDRLSRFVDLLPEDLPCAFEFRHPSWHATATGQLLQNHNVGWVSTDYIHLPQRVYVTTDFIYIRWIGEHGRYEVKDHERVDMTPRLEEWWADIRSRWQGLQNIHGFFNNDYAGHGPATCNRFKAIAGLPVINSRPPQQGRLF